MISSRVRSIVLMSLSCALFAAPPLVASADRSLAPSGEEDYLLLIPPSGLDFAIWAADVAAAGIVLRHSFPPAGAIALSSESSPFVPPGTKVFRDSPSGEDADLLTATVEGRMLWHAHRALTGVEPLEPESGLPPGQPLVDDGLPGPVELREVACDAYSLYRTNSEYMLGSVTVTIILPESVGAANTENWNVTLETNVSNEIVQGLNDLINLFPAGYPVASRPSWVYQYVLGRTDSRAQVNVEPIQGTHPTDVNPQWVNAVYDLLNYTADFTMWDKGRHFNGDQKAANGTNWAFTVFVANSAVDGDGLFSDLWSAYAYQGGPHVIMTYDNGTWGIGRMNEVTRHEVSHIFYATDEYSTSSCWCAETSGYVSYQNANCNKACSSNVGCVMRDNSNAMCGMTRGMIGWGDRGDLDGTPDPLEIDPANALNPYSPDPTYNRVLTYTGTATVQAVSNQNIYHYRCDVSIARITSVFWRVDGGAGGSGPATPVDGAFDGQAEPYTFTTPALPPGPHLIETFAVDNFAHTHAVMPASDTVTIVTPPGVPSGLTGVAMTVSKLAPNGNTLGLSWDPVTCGSSSHILVFGGGSQLPSAPGGTYLLSGSACGLGGTGSYAWLNTINPSSDPTNFYWWLILATDGASTEGSWGIDGAGLERSGPGPGGASLQCGIGGKNTSNSCGM
jgi:hypothetical protein